jgi:membrane protease YdiL (CAAX protease family)
MVRSMIRTVLADFRSFLAAPRLIVPGRFDWRTWAVMTGSYLVGLVVIGACLVVWQRAMQVPPPDSFSRYPLPVLIPAVVLAAPIGEEALFRGWLTGRPRALWLLAMGVPAALLLVAVSLHWHDQIAALGIVALAIAALVGWIVLHRRTKPPRWFARSFGVWFTLSVLVFGLAHMSNYPRLSWALMPMVLPQIWAGLVFGYLRMRHGLLASMLAHGCGNALALTVALVSAAH